MRSSLEWIVMAALLGWPVAALIALWKRQPPRWRSCIDCGLGAVAADYDSGWFCPICGKGHNGRLPSFRETVQSDD